MIDFLERLYGQAESGFLYLWTLQDKKTHWFSVTDINGIAKAAQQLSNSGKDVYFGVGLTDTKKATTKRAESNDIAAIPGIWMDLDCRDDKHPNNPDSIDELLSFIKAEFPLLPTVTVKSGRGLHIYFLFKELTTISNSSERQQYRLLMAGIQENIKQLGNRHGWKFDSTHDLSRVLRLPGTMNYKGAALPVEVIETTDHYYNTDDLEQYAVDISVSSLKESRSSSFTRLPSDRDASYIMEHCAFIAQFKNPSGLAEPAWFSALTILSRGVGGFELIHELVRPFLKEKYSFEKTEKKIQHAFYDCHPHTCTHIRQTHGFTGCPDGGCGMKSPVGWATAKKKGKKKTESPIPTDESDKWHPMEKLTDLGNAERFTRLFGEQLKYCFQFGSWLVWDGQRHKIDETGQVMLYAKKAIRSFYNDAAEIDSTDIRDAVLKHAKKSESHGAITAMIKLAQPMLPVQVNELDADQWLLNVKNGVVDLRTGELLKHDHTRLITKMAPVEYDPKAECPLFLRFLSSVFPSGERVISFVQRWLGYCLTGDTREQKMAIAWGNGANGKGTLLNLIQDIMGDYAQTTPTDTLMAKKNEGISNDVARLRGSRYVLASETQEGRRLNEPLIKQMTGQDRLTARFLHKEFFEFMPQFKLVLLTNHKPVASGDDAALWRRIMLIPFTQKFEGSKRDDTLKDRLRDQKEMSGILKWLVNGCLEWQKIGLNPPPEVINATAEYKNENDIMSNWIDECCVEGNLITAKTSDLYHNFMDWVVKNGEKVFVSQKKFSSSLQNKGFEIFKGGGGIKRARGIGLLVLEPELPLELVDSSAKHASVDPF